MKIKRTKFGIIFISKSCPLKNIFGVFSDGETRRGESVATAIVTRKLTRVMCYAVTSQCLSLSRDILILSKVELLRAPVQ